MSEPIRQRLERLLNDSTSFLAGQIEEQQRICRLIDIRIDQLHSIPSIKNRQQVCEELLRLRQSIQA